MAEPLPQLIPGSSVRLWDVHTGTVVGVLSGHRRDVRSLALSPNGRMVAASTRREAQLWNTETGELLHTLTKLGREAGSMAFSPDGSVVACGSFHGDAAVGCRDGGNFN